MSYTPQFRAEGLDNLKVEADPTDPMEMDTNLDQPQVGPMVDQVDLMDLDMDVLDKDGGIIITETEVQPSPSADGHYLTPASPHVIPIDSDQDADGEIDDELAVPQKPHDVLDLSKGKMHHIPEIINLYNMYHSAYANPNVTKEGHMQRACVFASTLLEHYFPPTQCFVVESVQFPTVKNYGWAIELKPPHNKDFGFQRHHHIQSKDIAGFKVSQIYSMTDKKGNESEKAFPHMYLAIVIDDLSTSKDWQTDTKGYTNLADIISFSMGVEAKISRGYAVVIVGPRIDFYAFDRTAKNPMTRLKNDNWSFDMRTQQPSLVDLTFEYVASQPVYYQNNVVGQGSTRHPLSVQEDCTFG